MESTIKRKRKKKGLFLFLTALLGLGGVSVAEASNSLFEQEMKAATYNAYTCDFESSSGFTAGQNYQSTISGTDTSDDAMALNSSGIGWQIYFGTWSTSNAISGSQSAAMRAYSNKTSNFGYLMTTTDIQGVTSITYSAKASTSNSANLLLDISYSIDSGSTWTLVDEAKSLTDSNATYTASFGGVSTSDGVRVKFAISNSSTFPSKTSSGKNSNTQMTIDDIAFSVTAEDEDYHHIAIDANESVVTSSYAVGDSFDTSGLVVKGYASESDATGTSIDNAQVEFATTPSIFTTDGSKTVSVTATYGELTSTTVEYSVNVAKKYGYKPVTYYDIDPSKTAIIAALDSTGAYHALTSEEETRYISLRSTDLTITNELAVPPASTATWNVTKNDDGTCTFEGAAVTTDYKYLTSQLYSKTDSSTG